MGVKGLTSYVAQIDRSLAKEVDFPVKQTQNETPASDSASKPTMIIDGWAWLYNAYLNNFPKTAKGGQYLEFSQHIKQLVVAWRSVGLNFLFVFDGPAEPKKLSIITSRTDSQCQKNASTMRLSSASRASARQGLLPPLTYLTSITTLTELGVEIIFAETEADGIVAELAQTRKGYAVSQDSDFFILSSKEKGCLGYVPLSSLEFVWKLPSDEQEKNRASNSPQEEASQPDDGFAPVKSKGRNFKRNQSSSGSIYNNNFSDSSRWASERQREVTPNLTVSPYPPPIPSSSSSDQQPTLSSFRFKSYLAEDLASCLDLPSNLLPLLAALCGNDFTSNQHANLLYSSLGRTTSKIPFVAKALRDEWLKSLNPKPKRSGTSRSSSSSRLNSGANTPSLSYKASFGSREVASGEGGPAAAKSESGRSVKSNATVTTSSSPVSPSKKDQIGKLSNKLSSIALANLTELNNSAASNQTPASTSVSKANSVISESDAQTVSNLTGSGFLSSDQDQEEELDPVKSLVKAVIDRLLELNHGDLKTGRAAYITSGEKDDLIEGILQGFESYSFASSQISFLTNPSFEFFNPEDESNHQRGLEVLKVFNENYKKGRFDTSLIEALTSRHWISKQFLEDPDEISAQAGPGRKLREWIYAILFDVWGMGWCRDQMEAAEGEKSDSEDDGEDIRFGDELDNDTSLRRKKWIGGDGYKSGEDPDDVISVNDESSGSEFSNSYQSEDAPIHSMQSKEEATNLNERMTPERWLSMKPAPIIPNFQTDEDDNHADDQNQTRRRHKNANADLPPPAVMEYIRRGTRLVPELTQIRSLTDLLKGGSSDESDPPESPIQKLLDSNFNPLPSSLGDLLAQYEAAQTTIPDVADVNASIATIKSDPLPSPLPSHPLSTRLDLFLVANHSNLGSLKEKIPIGLWSLCSSVRFMVLEGASRYLETSKKKNWKRKEIETLLRVGVCCYNLNRMIIQDEKFSVASCLGSSTQDSQESKRRNLFNMLSTRVIHLNTSVQMILELNHYLSQSLLIDEELKSSPEKFIDGDLLALELCRIENKSFAEMEGLTESFLPKEALSEKDEQDIQAFLNVVLEGLDDVLGIDVEEERRLRKAEKKKAGKAQAQLSNSNAGNNGAGGGSGVKLNPFDLLGEE